MKAIVGLESVLYSQDVHFVADLVTVGLGTPVYLTSWQSNLSYDSKTWTAGAALGGARRRSTLGGELEVDTLTLSFAPAGLTVDGLSWQMAALREKFTGITVTVDRAYMVTPGTVPGAVQVFSGSVTRAIPSSTLLRLEAKSVVARLAGTVLPPRKYEVACPYQVYDTRCGASTSGHTDATKTVAGGTTPTTLVLSSSSTYAVAGGWVVIGSDKRGIASVSGATLQLTTPYPVAPTVGAGVTIYRGCPHTSAACSGTFNNLARYGGFPQMPTPEAG